MTDYRTLRSLGPLPAVYIYIYLLETLHTISSNQARGLWNESPSPSLHLATQTAKFL